MRGRLLTNFLKLLLRSDYVIKYFVRLPRMPVREPLILLGGGFLSTTLTEQVRVRQRRGVYERRKAVQTRTSPRETRLGRVSRRLTFS